MRRTILVSIIVLILAVMIQTSIIGRENQELTGLKYPPRARAIKPITTNAMITACRERGKLVFIVNWENRAVRPRDPAQE